MRRCHPSQGKIWIHPSTGCICQSPLDVLLLRTHLQPFFQSQGLAPAGQTGERKKRNPRAPTPPNSCPLRRHKAIRDPPGLPGRPRPPPIVPPLRCAVGRVAGNSIFNVTPLGDLEVGDDDRCDGPGGGPRGQCPVARRNPEIVSLWGNPFLCSRIWKKLEGESVCSDVAQLSFRQSPLFLG